MLRHLALASAVALAPNHGHHTHPPKHVPGCNTRACDDRIHHNKRIGRIWWEKHKPAFRITPEELCVANHESGAGGPSTTPSNARYSTINWRYDDGEHEGGFNWLPSTWATMKLPGYPSRAVNATPTQQVKVFRIHKYDPGQWPPSELAECGL